MSEDVKFCKDCRHFNNSLLECYICCHPNNGRDIVTGRQIEISGRDCRNNEEKCGLAGRWFELLTEEEIERRKKAFQDWRAIMSPENKALAEEPSKLDQKAPWWRRFFSL